MAKANQNLSEAEARRKMNGEPPNFRDAGLDGHWANKVSRLKELRLEIEEAKEKASELSAEVGAGLSAAGYKTVICGDWRVTVVEGRNVTVDKARLLELGVPAKTILEATKETPYVTVSVTEIK